ncbi:hypothetical protein F5Y19DRAFT_474543 [Xylariaceae sp. FL1651]|nr:hypothetical protein F5Y19DRAFT_474543 [Xylariaceae sp. FL1651]
MLHYIVKAVVLATIAGLAFVTEGHRRAIDIGVRGVGTIHNTTLDTLPKQFHQNWVETGKMEFLCGSEVFSQPVNGDSKPAKVADCNVAMTYLLYGYKGYWKVSEWISGDGMLHSYKIYGWGTCQVWAYTTLDEEVHIGSGDVYALIEKTVADYTNGGETVSTANLWCGNTQIFWGIENGN